VHFCAGRPAWPSAREFKSAGHTDLYVAASRYGGVAFWAAELGLPRASRRWEAPSLPRLRLSLSWAMIGALGGALAVGAAVAIVQGFPRAAPKAVAEHAGSVATPRVPTAKSSTRRARTSPKRATTAKARVNSRTKTSHAAVQKPSSSTSTTQILAVRTVSASPPRQPTAPSTTSSTRAGTTTTSSSTGSGGPTPLMAPGPGPARPHPSRLRLVSSRNKAFRELSSHKKGSHNPGREPCLAVRRHGRGVRSAGTSRGLVTKLVQAQLS
jgi:hypothetical protein